jgi:hypothetical protein
LWRKSRKKAFPGHRWGDKSIQGNRHGKIQRARENPANSFQKALMDLQPLWILAVMLARSSSLNL